MACLCCAELTGDPADGPSHVRPGVSGYVGAQTVAYEVHVLQGELLFVLLEKEVATVTSAAATTTPNPHLADAGVQPAATAHAGTRAALGLTQSNDGPSFPPSQFGSRLCRFKTAPETLLAKQ